MARNTDRIMINPVVERIVDLIKKQGRKEKDLTDFLGMSPGAMSKWKYDGSFMYIKHIEAICTFLGTTPNYLFLGPEDKEERLTLVEREMIEIYRNLDETRKKYIQDTLKYISE